MVFLLTTTKWVHKYCIKPLGFESNFS